MVKSEHQLEVTPRRVTVPRKGPKTTQGKQFSPELLSANEGDASRGATLERGTMNEEAAGSQGTASAHAQALDTASQFAIQHQGHGLTALVADAMALAIAAVGAAAVSSLIHAPSTTHAQSFVFTTTLIRLLISVPPIALLLASSGTHWRLRTTAGEQLSAIVPALAVGGLISLGGWRLASGAGLVRGPKPDAVLIMCAMGLVTVSIVRLAHHARPRGQGRHARRVLLVGSGVVAARVTEQFNVSGDVEVIGFVDDDPADHAGCVGKLGELAFVCERDSVDHVVVCFSRASPETLIDALRPIQGQVPITVVPRLFDVLPLTATVHDLGSGLPGISVPPATLGWGPRAAKRTMDLLGTGIALLLLSPIFGVLAIAIKATSRGPVIFHQVRVGKNSQAFRMLKFRTMVVEHSVKHPTGLSGEAAMGPFPKLKDDPRVTSIGGLLRRTSLDELPQLWNVIRGEMSLVGPRPFIPEDDAWITDWAQRRYSVRPGITGLWQVSGRNNLTFDEMCRLDGLYVSCWSPGLDIRILLRTLRAVLSRSGAY
jgi:exopolysaccharide biosynthesis polyprenyl glycosylphosphotransferase